MKLEPKLKDQIKEWEKAVTPETAKKLLIRSGAMKAYKEGNIEPIVKETLLEIESLITVGQMTKSEIGTLIGRLESARMILSSLTQGFQIAHADEIEPEFKAKHEKEEREKRKSKPKTLGDSLSGLGISLEDVMAALNAKNPVTKESPAPTIEKVAISSPKTGKIKCDKCAGEFWPAMKEMHKC